jgi:hypothetical protein
MLGLGDNTEVVKKNIKYEDDTDSETELDILDSNKDTLDSILEHLPSQINKSIELTVNKLEPEKCLDVDIDAIVDDDGDADVISVADDNTDEDDDNTDDECDIVDDVVEDKHEDVVSAKLDGNNKLRMRKINLIKKKNTNEEI